MLITEGSSLPSAEGFFIPPLGDTGPAVTVTGGGAGGAGGAFDIVGNSVVRCGLMFGRSWLTCEDFTSAALAAAPKGIIYASVAHAAGRQPKLSVVLDPRPYLPNSTLDVSNRLLYRAEENGQGGSSWADYRSAITILAMD